MSSKRTQARRLALAIQSGAWERAALTDRLSRTLPPALTDPAQLAARLHLHFGPASRPALDSLLAFLQQEPLLERVFERQAVQGLLLDPPVVGSRPDALLACPLPELATWKDVGVWLNLTDTELAWFADQKSQQGNLTEHKLHHYRYAWVRKASGALRLIEIPKCRLKSIQKVLVRDILNQLPPHACAHGFCRGRSIRTFVAPHVGKDVVLRLDLKDFFHTVPVARIGALFRRLGYPPTVAWLLQGLCTHSVSPSLAGRPFAKLPWKARKGLHGKHLPQGAPTSPQLANLCTWRLDQRLDGLAKRFGFQYTRYADDLAFSGSSELAGMAKFVEALVGAIVLEEGFQLNHRKTRLRLSSQRQCLAGIVVNETTNGRRADWDQLKAILYNCVKHGPESQNRDRLPHFKAHLLGRVRHMAWLNPARGDKLQRLWDRIVWEV